MEGSLTCMSHLFPYRWNLADGYPAKGIPYHGRKVFGTFICGGGSTMGYKLAGFDHLGGVEIDPKVAAVYKANHKPKHLYVEDIRAFNERTDLPAELFSLDLLDGSPPCSSFSMAGSREKGWGRKRYSAKDRHTNALTTSCSPTWIPSPSSGQRSQSLKTSKGCLAGNAKVYAKEIVKRLRGHGYTVQVFLLNAATMGVPQMRERCFFIARQDATWPNLVLKFEEPPIPFGQVYQPNDEREHLAVQRERLWKTARIGHKATSDNGDTFGFLTRLSMDKVAPTLVAGNSHCALPHEPSDASMAEYRMIGSYPADYAFGDIPQKYLIGMSVPPVMTAQIAHQINLQWFSKLSLN
jgi:DNA (cytosine-5)-methyltransferase 1